MKMELRSHWKQSTHGGAKKFVQICVTVRIENIQKTTIKKTHNINSPSYPPPKRNILPGKQAVRQCISVTVFALNTTLQLSLYDQDTQAVQLDSFWTMFSDTGLAILSDKEFCD